MIHADMSINNIENIDYLIRTFFLSLNFIIIS